MIAYVHLKLGRSWAPAPPVEGAEIMVQKVRAAVNVRFQNMDNKPDQIFVDRGRGFYNVKTGKITEEYKTALSEHGLHNAMGTCAKVQPGNYGDLLLHETAVAWMRERLRETLPKNCWLETREEYGRRLKTCAESINNHYDVEALCRGFLKRMDALVAAQGQRLKY